MVRVDKDKHSFEQPATGTPILPSLFRLLPFIEVALLTYQESVCTLTVYIVNSLRDDSLELGICHLDVRFRLFPFPPLH